MREPWALDVAWWISVVELPALAGLFVAFWRQRREIQTDLEAAARGQATDLGQLRDTLADHRLEVAKSYASIAYLQEVERRLTRHLIRIENKLDAGNHPKTGDVP